MGDRAVGNNIADEVTELLRDDEIFGCIYGNAPWPQKRCSSSSSIYISTSAEVVIEKGVRSVASLTCICRDKATVEVYRSNHLVADFCNI